MPTWLISFSKPSDNPTPISPSYRLHSRHPSMLVSHIMVKMYTLFINCLWIMIHHVEPMHIDRSRVIAYMSQPIYHDFDVVSPNWRVILGITSGNLWLSIIIIIFDSFIFEHSHCYRIPTPAYRIEEYAYVRLIVYGAVWRLKRAFITWTMTRGTVHRIIRLIVESEDTHGTHHQP